MRQTSVVPFRLVVTACYHDNYNQLDYSVDSLTAVAGRLIHFQCNEQCQDAYLSLLASNGTSSSSCQSLCDAKCTKLLQNVSCHCSEMSQVS